MKNKGFTLIELLAVIVILGIILIIAIPQVSSYIDSTKVKTMRTTAQVYINAVRDYSTSKNKFPYKGTTKKYTLNDIVTNIGLDKDNKKSPYGDEWDLDNSYVNQTLSEDYKDTYSVYLIDKGGHCIEETSEKDLDTAEVKICTP